MRTRARRAPYEPGALRPARACIAAALTIAVVVAGCLSGPPELLVPTTAGVVVEREDLPAQGRTVAYHLDTGEVIEIDLAAAEIIGGPGGPGVANLLLSGTRASGRTWLVGLPEPGDRPPGCFQLVATGIGTDGWIDISDGLRLKKAADFDPGVVTDDRYATERYAFCLNSRGEVTSYGF